MNIFNRLLVIILLLAAMGGSAIVLFFLVEAPETIISPSQVALSRLAGVMSTLPAQNRLFFAIGMGGIIWLMGGILLWLEFYKPQRRTIRITGIDDLVEVEVQAIEERLSHHLQRLSDVDEVLVDVEARRNKVEVDLLLGVAPVVHIPMKTREVQSLTREVIEEQMGVEIENIRVSLRQTSRPTESKQVKLA